jgi:hypothetical protein
MPRFLTELLPPNVNCPHCGASMALDDEERTFKRFKCPACRKKIDLRTRVVDDPITNPALLFKNLQKSVSGQGTVLHVTPDASPPVEVNRRPSTPLSKFLPHRLFKR